MWRADIRRRVRPRRLKNQKTARAQVVGNRKGDLLSLCRRIKGTVKARGSTYSVFRHRGSFSYRATGVFGADFLFRLNWRSVMVHLKKESFLSIFVHLPRVTNNTIIKAFVNDKKSKGVQSTMG